MAFSFLPRRLAFWAGRANLGKLAQTPTQKTENVAVNGFLTVKRLGNV